MQMPTIEDNVKTEKNIMRPKRFGAKKEPSEFEERVIEVRRVARTVKGGRRIRFRAVVVIGNKKGKIGMGIAKANDVAEAVRKAVAIAKKNLVLVKVIDGTIPYELIAKHGSARVLLKPATSGTSIVAGGSIRAVAELSGYTDLISKMLGSSSKINNIIAAIKGLASFNPEYVKKIEDFVKNAEGKKEKASEEKTEEPKEVVEKKKAVKKSKEAKTSDSEKPAKK